MINISGIIIPVSWDTKGNVLAMAIATHREEEYFIEVDDKDFQTRSLLRQEVEITGILKGNGEKKIIKIINITKKKINS